LFSLLFLNTLKTFRSSQLF